MKIARLSILAVIAAAALAGAAGAEEADFPANEDGLKVTTTAKRLVQVVNDKGEKEPRLEDVAAVVPGERLVMLITYANRGKEPARNVVLVNPVPAEMTYVGGSAAGDGADITFSVDGKSFDAPENLFVADADGNKRRARPEEYTHIRWVLRGPLAPGEFGQARFESIIK